MNIIKTGPGQLELKPYQHLRIEGSTKYSVMYEVVTMDEETGEEKRVYMPLQVVDRFIDVKGKKNGVKLYIDIQDGQHWTYTDMKPYVSENVSDIPVELLEDRRIPMTLEEKLKRFIREEVSERYGRDSREMETLEEFTDFGDEENDDEPLSGYEVFEMQEEKPIIKEEPESPAKPADPEPGEDPKPSGTEADAS